jgi:hypothetical protein
MAKERLGLSMVDRIALPIIVAVLAFAASLIAAKTSNSGAAENQRNQIEEQKRKDDRDRRNDIYLGYMDAVAAYAVPFRASVQCLYAAEASAQPCIDALRAAREPEQQLRNAFNRVAMYGSERVYQSGSRLYLVMLTNGDSGLAPGMVVPAPGAPPAAPSREIAVPGAVPQMPARIDDPVATAQKLESDYKNAYDDLLRAMCEELSAVPRTRC